MSNAIHAYDEINPILNVKRIFESKSSLPPKLRFKLVDTLHMIGSFVVSIQPTIERLSYFQSLPMNARRALIKHNLPAVGSIHGIFATHEINAFSEPAYVAACYELFGSTFVNKIMSICKRLESNLTFVKLMIFTLYFSSNCSVVTFDNNEDIRIISNPINFIQIQDIYVTILWKYMIYQCGFIETVRHYSGLIKTSLDILQIDENLYNVRKHQQIISAVIKDIEHSLGIREWMVQ